MQENRLDAASVLAALNAAQVRFVLIGGLAMVSHGSDHVTQDIDIFYSRDRENLPALAQAIAPHHPRLRGAPEGLPFILDAQTLRNTPALTLLTDLGSVDLLGEVSGAESFESVWQRAVETEIYGIPVRVVSLDDLIVMKRAANRLKDQGHVLELEALRRLTQENT